MEKMQINDYTIPMSQRDDHLVPFKNKHSGEDIHNVINDVFLDYEDSKIKRKNIELTIYYRDLLSFLIKTYGH